MAIKIKQQQSQFASQVQTNSGLQYRLPKLERPSKPRAQRLENRAQVLSKFITSLAATIALVLFFILLSKFSFPKL